MNTKNLSSSNDKFIPIELSDMTYDEESESLVFKLSAKVDQKWIHKFQTQKAKRGGIYWSVPNLIDVSLFEFHENIARLAMPKPIFDSLPKKNTASPLSPPSPTLEHIRNTYFKGYLEKANSMYEEMLKDAQQNNHTNV